MEYVKDHPCFYIEELLEKLKITLDLENLILLE